jgi:RHS repeat-associated protein
VRVKAPGRDHTYLYDSKWQLTNVTNTVGGASVIGLSYDPQGNLTNKNGVLYDFDMGNRLRAVTGKEFTYRYDALGRRVLAVSNLGTVLSQYCGGGELVHQFDGRRSMHLDYLYLAGSLVAIQERPFAGGLNIKYQHTDALGSPVAVTDASRAVIERSEYEPYGLLLNRVLHDGPGFTGHVSDAATGLSYMQQRYYDPQIGRFLSVDPVTAQSDTGTNFNRYWYANNNPYRFYDPDGRITKQRLEQIKERLIQQPFPNNRINKKIVGQKGEIKQSDGRFNRRGGPYRSRKHDGVDIGAKKGDTVPSAADGKATVKEDPNGYGSYVDIDHGDGIVTRQAHLDTVSVKSGDHVNAGDGLGTVGRSGNVPETAGTHEHFEIIINGERIDPQAVFTWKMEK